MGYGRNRRDSRFLAGRGAVVASVVALHALAIVAFSNAGIRHRFIDTAPPVEVVFLEERAPTQAPPQEPTRLVDVRPVDVVLPVLDLPSEPPAPAAITVSPPKVQAAAAPVAAQSDVPVMVDGVDYMRPPSPRYPPSAKRAHVQGVVFLRVLIDRDGRPRDVTVHRSSGSEQLDAAARESVFQALFKPHRENGETRSAQVIIPIEFSLKIRSASRGSERRGEFDGVRDGAQTVGLRRAD
jgi:periplasmic protein TonB